MFPLPRDFDLGSFELDLPMKEGKVMLKNQVVAGKDIELVLDGSITLMNPVARSALNLDVFKPTEELLKSDPLIKALLKNLKKDGKGFQKSKKYEELSAECTPEPRLTSKSHLILQISSHISHLGTNPIREPIIGNVATPFNPVRRRINSFRMPS